MPRSTLYHQRQAYQESSSKAKRGRKPVWSDEFILESVRVLIAETEAFGFHGEGYRKLWARLRFQGVTIDQERLRLLLGKHNLLAPHRCGKPKGPKAHTGTIIPIGANLMWGTDATSTYTSEHGNVTVFAALDHYTGECVGIHAAIIGNRFEALEPIRQGVKEYFGSYSRKSASGLTLRHDHGSQYMSKHFQKEIRFLGIVSSPSFVRSPEGNGVIERFFRTLKEQLLWIKRFRTVDELVDALHEFKHRYNHHWIMQRHGYRTPKQVRDEWNAAMIKVA